MANFDRSGMTQAGINLMGKAIGGATIQFTKLVLGDGEMTGEILDLKGVVSAKQNVDVTRIERNDNQCTVGGELLTSSVKQGFWWRECGLYAMDPDVGEVLYNYAYSTKPDYIASSNSGMMEEILVSIVATVGSNTNVDVTIDDSMVFATKKQIGDMTQVKGSIVENIVNINKQITILNACDFGLKNEVEDINFDNTSVLINIINYINTNGGYFQVRFPKGIYRFKQGKLPPITTHENTFIGDGFDITILVFADSTYFQFGDDTRLCTGGGIKNLTIQYKGGNENLINPTVKAYNCARQEYTIKYWVGCTFIEAGTTSKKAYSQSLKNCKVGLANKGKPFIKLVNGAGFYWCTFDGISHIEATTPPWNTTSIMNTMVGTNAIDVVGSWDTIELKIFAEKLYRVLNIDNPTGVVYNIKDNGSVLDYIRDTAFYFNLDTSGSLVSTSISNTYITTWEGYGIYAYSNSKDLRYLNINNVNILYSGKEGVYLDGIGQSVRDFNILNSRIRGTGRTNNGHAVLLGRYLVKYNIANNIIGGSDTASNVTWGENTGLAMKYALDNVTKSFYILNNICEVCIINPSSYILPTQDNTKNMLIKNNSNNNYEGFKSNDVTLFKKPLTDESWYNVTPHEIEVYIGGNNVLELYKNGTKLPFTNGLIRLIPKDSYKIKYTDSTDISIKYNVLN